MNVLENRQRISDPVFSIARWGPAGWDFITAAAIVYPEDPPDSTRQTMHTFLHALGPVLPCPRCRVHFAESLKTLDEKVLASRQTLLLWIHTVRNDIRQRQGKSRVTYDTFIKDCYHGTNSNTLLWVLVVVVFVIFMLSR